MPSTHVAIHIHCVFSTKHREPILPTQHLPRIHKYLGGIVRNQGAASNGVGGVEDHIHLLVGCKSTHRIADVMREVKSVSSSWIAREFCPGFKWQEGFGAFSFAATDKKSLQSYVNSQREHHQRSTFQEEYRDLLEQGLVEYKEEYLW